MSQFPQDVLVRPDCRHFRGDVPCRPNKTDGYIGDTVLPTARCYFSSQNFLLGRILLFIGLSQLLSQVRITGPNVFKRAYGTSLSLCLLLTLLLAGRSTAQSWQWVAAPTSDETSFSEVTALAADVDGTTVAAGNFSGTVTFGKFTLTSLGNVNVFVARLDRAGNWLQAVRAGSTNQTYVSSLLLDSDGTTVIAGSFSGRTAGFGAITLVNDDDFGNSSDVFVARLTRAGIWSQAVRAGGPSLDGVTALALDRQGNIVVAGSFTSPLAHFGSLTLTNANDGASSSGTDDIFVARLTKQGQWLQAVRAGGVAHDYPTAVVIDTDGSVLVAGNMFSPEAHFDTHVLRNASPNGANADLFVAGLSSSGEWISALRAGGPDYDHVTDIALTSDGAIAVAGCFFGPATVIGSHTLLNADETGIHCDAFIAHLDRNGNWTQAVRAGGLDNDEVLRIKVNSDDALTVAGYFSGPSASFGPTTLSCAGNDDIFLGHLTTAGLWTDLRQVGGAGRDGVHALLLTTDTELTIAGGIGEPGALFGPFAVANSNLYFPKAYVAHQGGSHQNGPSGSPPPTSFYIPNIITPNGDGQNEAFRFQDVSGTDWSLCVYDRWGHEVYQTLHYQQDWAAADVCSGVYYYLLGRHDGGSPIKGWLEVVR